MLSISQPMHGSGCANYYVGQAQEEYAMCGGAPPSRWEGVGAEKLKLSGSVDAQTLKHLFDGFSPDGQKKLVRNAGSPNRQSAWDLTFSAPKAVSVLLAFSEPEQQRLVVNAHERAVRVALNYLENVAGFTRRGQGGGSIERTPLTFATFRHTLSRALQPQLHTHAALINLAQRRDGTTGTLYTKEIFRHKKRAGAVYQADLAVGLQQDLKLKLEARGDGFGIVGISDAVCVEFSKRQKEIRALCNEKGWEGAIARKLATLWTRAKKEKNIEPKALFQMWCARAAVHGFGQEAAQKLYAEGIRKTKIAPSEEEGLLKKLSEHLRENRAYGSRAATSAKQFAIAQGLTGAALAKFFCDVIPSAPITIERKRLFPKAPWWSRASKVNPPYLAFQKRRAVFRRKPRSRLLFEKRIPFGVLQIRQKMLFPSAPWWSPARKLSLPHLAIKKRSDGTRRKPRDRKVLEKRLKFCVVEDWKKPLFQSVPKWSPAKKIELPFVRLKKSESLPEPTLRLRR